MVEEDPTGPGRGGETLAGVLPLPVRWFLTLCCMCMLCFCCFGAGSGLGGLVDWIERELEFERKYGSSTDLLFMAWFV